MPTDPATVPPLTDAEVRAMIVESFREDGCLSSFDTNATDAEFLSYYSGATKRLRAAYALAASRVDTAEVERRAKYEAPTEARSVAMRPGTWEQVDDRLKAFAEKYAPAPVASAPEGFTDRTEWDDKATIVNPAWCATEVDIENAKREAARKALAECAAWLGKGESQPVRFDEDGRFLLAFERVNAFSDRYLAREHPAPAPRECVLSDGSVVIVDVEATKRDTINTPCLRRGNHTVLVGDWIRLLITAHDTGADFDALKRFAAEVGR